jgi:branched-chain amino acid transport system permease protein
VSFLNALIQGALVGGLYAIYAAGLALIFGVMRLVNLAHGDFIVLAAYLLLALMTSAFLPAWVAILVAIPFMFALGWGLQRLILNRTLKNDLLVPLLVTFGLSIIIQNGLLLQFSADSRRLSLGALETASWSFGEISVGVVPLMTFAAAVLVIVGLTLLFYRTSLGRTLRATSDSTEVVQLMGVDPRKVFAVAMGISFVVILIAAFFMGIRANFDPSTGPSRLLFAFEAVVIGGLGSFWGTLIGGVILGIAQTIGATINPEWQQLAGHVVFLAIILVRPRGLLARA